MGVIREEYALSPGSGFLSVCDMSITVTKGDVTRNPTKQPPDTYSGVISEVNRIFLQDDKYWSSMVVSLSGMAADCDLRDNIAHSAIPLENQTTDILSPIKRPLV